MRYLLEEEIMYKYIPRAMLSILCLAVLAIASMSCININMPQSPAENKTSQGDQAVPPASTALPAIVSFGASPETVLEGKSSTLSWSVQNATAITIIPDIGPVAATGSKTVKPPAATTYTLIASNAAGMNSKAVVVNILTVRRMIGPDLIETTKPDLIVWIDESLRRDNTISYLITNKGDATSVACKNVLFVDGVQKSEDSVGGIGPGQQLLSSFHYSSVPVPKWHTFEVKIDVTNTNSESDKNNNSMKIMMSYE
jgi:hypothetical protein